MAVAAAVLHAAGLALAALVLRRGSPLMAAEERARWLAGQPLGWAIGWSVWMTCALSLVALLAVVASRLADGGDTAAGALAVALGSAAAGIDLVCDALWITLVPELAAQGPDRVFLAVERALTVGGTVAANGLYSVAVLVLTIALPGRWRGVRMLGLLTVACGLGLCAAGAAGDPGVMAAFSGLTIASVIVWALGLARAFASAT